MAQHIEELRSATDGSVIIFSATADTETNGTAVFAYGVWFTQEELTEISAMLARANAFIAQGE